MSANFRDHGTFRLCRDVAEYQWGAWRMLLM
jgi:hypothetical protein